MINYSPWQPIAIALDCFFFKGQWESDWGYVFFFQTGAI